MNNRTAASGETHVPLWESVFAVFGILLCSRALNNIFSVVPMEGEAIAPGGITAKLVIYLAFYGITAVLLMRDWNAFLQLVSRQKILVSLLVLALFSPLWSFDPMTSLEKVVGLFGCTSLGLYLYLRFPALNLLQILAAALAIILMASFFVALAYPETGLMTGAHEDLWRGVFQHKNRLGRYSVLAGVVFVTLAIWQPNQRALLIAGCGFALLLVVMSGSKTSLICGLIVFSCLAFYLFRDGRRGFAVGVTLFALISGACLVTQTVYKIVPSFLISEPANCLQKKLSGSSGACNIIEAASLRGPQSLKFKTGRGRVELWGHVLHKVKERPLLGYGVGGFWRGNKEPSNYIWEREPWHPTHAHNGFVDLAAQLGLIGAVIFGASVFSPALFAIRSGLTKGAQMETIVFGAILGSLLLGNLGESFLLKTNSFTWALMVATLLTLSSAERTTKRALARE
ncbi:O-antigen ligase family protein [Candidatus Marimicrobium litorale]|nr:O-antigen ligase family protein [Candidatus Marimicrobium litorale]